MSDPSDRRRLTDPPEPITDDYVDFLRRLVRGEVKAISIVWPLAVNDLLAEVAALRVQLAELEARLEEWEETSPI